MVTGPANADTETTDRSLRCPLIGRNSREWSTFGRWFSYRHDTLAEPSFHFGSSRTSFCSTLTNNTLLHSSGYCSLFFFVSANPSEHLLFFALFYSHWPIECRSIGFSRDKVTVGVHWNLPKTDSFFWKIALHCICSAKWRNFFNSFLQFFSRAPTSVRALNCFLT